MGLPDDEMQKLTSSVTDRVPEPPCPLQLASESAATHCLQGCSPTVCPYQQCKTNKPRAGLARLPPRLSFFLPRASG
jgi:hypothetical protein